MLSSSCYFFLADFLMLLSSCCLSYVTFFLLSSLSCPPLAPVLCKRVPYLRFLVSMPPQENHVSTSYSLSCTVLSLAQLSITTLYLTQVRL